MAITAGLAQAAIQTALYTLLSGDATLLALLPGGGVYDDVPDGTVANYVAIGEWTEVSDDTLEDDNAGVGSDCTVALHIVTDDAKTGPKYSAGQAIASRMKVLLHGTTLTLSGFTNVLTQHEETVAMRDEDEQGRPKRHLVSTYRIVAEAT